LVAPILVGARENATWHSSAPEIALSGAPMTVRPLPEPDERCCLRALDEARAAEEPMISRRRLLLSSVLAGFAALLPRSVSARPAAERLLTVFAHRESARRIGTAVLATLPAGTGERALTKELVRREPRLRTALAGGDDAEIADALRRAIAVDFEEGRLHTVDGWVLSRTEAELCALARLV
jgi:hypothetical protein